METLRAESTLHRRAAVALCGGAAMVAVPLAVLSGPAQAVHSASRGGDATASLDLLAGSTAPSGPAMGEARLRSIELAIYESRLASQLPVDSSPLTTTTSPPPPPPSPTTTTTAPLPPPPPPPAPGPTSSMTGEATWYTSPWSTGCASPTLPFGIQLEVTNDATGASASCTVDDREPDHPGRVVDLSQTVFSELASLTEGVITVTLTW